MAEPATGVRSRALRRVRTSWADALLALVCVALAGWLVTWSQGLGGVAEERVGLRQSAALSDSGQTVKVSDRRAAQQVSRSSGGSPMETRDQFLGLRLVLETPGERVEDVVECELHQGDAVVRPAVRTLVQTPQPGYRGVVDLVFERPADGLVGATLVCRPPDVIRTWHRELVFDLGIQQAEVDRWTRSPKPLVLDLDGFTEVLR